MDVMASATSSPSDPVPTMPQLTLQQSTPVTTPGRLRARAQLSEGRANGIVMFWISNLRASASMYLVAHTI